MHDPARHVHHAVSSSITTMPPEPSIERPWRRVVSMAMSISSALKTGQELPPGITAFSFLPFAHAAGHFVNELLHVHAQGNFINPGFVYAARNAKQSCAAIFRRAAIA